MDSINYSFMPVVSLGLKESVNLYALLLPFVFVYLILFFAKNISQVYLCGFVYYLTIVCGYFYMVLGGVDSIVYSNIFLLINNYYCLLLAVGFLSMGALNFLDWRSLKKGKGLDKCFLRIPVQFFINDAGGRNSDDKKAYKILNGVLKGFICVCFIIIAASLVLVQVNWEKNYYLTLLAFIYASGKHVIFAGQSFFVYSLAYSVLLLLTWIGLVYFYKYSLLLRENTNILIYTKAFLSLSSLALGICLICFNFV